MVIVALDWFTITSVVWRIPSGDINQIRIIFPFLQLHSQIKCYWHKKSSPVELWGISPHTAETDRGRATDRLSTSPYVAPPERAVWWQWVVWWFWCYITSLIWLLITTKKRCVLWPRLPGPVASSPLGCQTLAGRTSLSLTFIKAAPCSSFPLFPALFFVCATLYPADSLILGSNPLIRAVITVG